MASYVLVCLDGVSVFASVAESGMFPLAACVIRSDLVVDTSSSQDCSPSTNPGGTDTRSDWLRVELSLCDVYAFLC